MPITVDASAFPTFQQARKFLLVPDADTSRDQLLADIVSAVGQFFEALTDRKLKSRSYTNVVVDGHGISTLMLPEYPVTAIASLKVDADRGFAAATPLVQFDGTGTQIAYDFVLVEDGIAGQVELTNGAIFPDDFGVVQVSYTAGLDPTTMLDVTQAQLLLIEDWWHQAGRDPSLVSFSQGGISKVFQLRQSGVNRPEYPPKVEAAIRALKRPSFE